VEERAPAAPTSLRPAKPQPEAPADSHAAGTGNASNGGGSGNLEGEDVDRAGRASTGGIPTTQAGGTWGPDVGVGPKRRFAVIGDYGYAGPAEQQVSELVASFAPDFVVTTGDNNYPHGAASTIDDNIGQYFARFIHPYTGKYGPGATENRFFPTLGNHDWLTAGAAPYLDYFSLPGNERYYDIVRGDVHFFAIDSDSKEPDGISANSAQGQWLEAGLKASEAAFQVVAMHHPPYSSGPHGSTPIMQWPYGQWGADLVLAGHDHGYERIERDGTTYVVAGLGGASIYAFYEHVEGSIVRYNGRHGAGFVEVSQNQLRLSFVNVEGLLIDSHVIPAP
jgi:tartrate-resistant acid phosphatase type 5